MGYKVKEVRLAKNMTQQELSEKSGISRATISAIENGTERYVLTGTLIKLADALGVTIDAIFFCP